MHWLRKKKKEDPEARRTTRTQGPRSGVGSQVGRPCASANATHTARCPDSIHSYLSRRSRFYTLTPGTNTLHDRPYGT